MEAKRVRGSSAKSRFFTVFIIVIALVIILAVTYLVAPKYVKNSVCISREISGDDDKTVILNVDVSFFKRPNSFVVEERFPQGWKFVSSDPQTLFFPDDGKVSWMFWSGGLPVKDTKIVYHVTNSSEGSPQGSLVIAKETGNPDAGYNEVQIGPGQVCI